MQSMSENDFECFASTGVKSPANAMFEAHEYAIPTGHRQTHALIVGVAKADAEAASFHLGFEVENPKGFHAVWRDRVLVVDDSDGAKPEGLDKSLHDLVMRDRAVRFRCHWCWHQS
jgi:hypothetical protein